MTSTRQLSMVLAAVIAVSALFAVRATAQTSRVIPFSNVVTTLPSGTPAQALTVQLWDVPTGGTAPLFAENQTLDVDASGNISFVFGSATAGGLDPVNFPSGSSRFLDVVDSATLASVLAPPGRVSLTAVAFALSPGPQGAQGIQGQPGPPGVVQAIAPADGSISVAGTAANPTIALAPNGISNAHVANGALSPAKIAGTAATLGANTFLATQTVQTFSDRYGTTHTDGIVTVGSFVGRDISGPVGGYYGTQSNHPLFFFTNNGFAQMALSTAGKVGIGTTTPISKLHVQNGTTGVGLGASNAIVGECNSAGCAGVVGSVANGQAGVLGVATGANAFAVQGIASGGALAGSFTGTVQMNVLSILGGADLAERFEVSAPDTASANPHRNRIEAGMVVSIDPKRPGALVLSSRTYDHRAAGVISGAGGVKAGMLMGQLGSVADGDQPVALAGRVYCWADDSNGPIEPGDLLTTSGTSGHAMKVTDHRKAQGAIVGKALTGLREGNGLILILVTLR